MPSLINIELSYLRESIGRCEPKRSPHHKSMSEMSTAQSIEFTGEPETPFMHSSVLIIPSDSVSLYFMQVDSILLKRPMNTHDKDFIPKLPCI
jgi:hypothetical protein